MPIIFQDLQILCFLFYVIQDDMVFDPVFLTGTSDAFRKNIYLNIFPNPAKDFINVDFSKANEKYFVLQSSIN